MNPIVKGFIILGIIFLLPELILLITAIITDILGKNKIALYCYCTVYISMPIKPIKKRIRFICGLNNTDYCIMHNTCKYKFCPIKEYSDKHYNIDIDKPTK